MEFKDKLKKRAEEIGITLDAGQLEQFEMFYRMLLEKNKVMNLTAITEENEVIDKHFIDSLTCGRVVDFSKVSSVVDIGTGAGFPGIPLKIAYPELSFVLIDSLKKRVNFLEEVIDALGLEKIKAIHGRAEDLARDQEYRASFSLCVSRAVANLSTLSEYCIPFVKVNGYFVSYKAGKGLEEIKLIDSCMKALGSKIEKTDIFQLPGEDSSRVLIKIKKCKGTAKRYPRKAGVPSKNPL
ncbi:MAG: 16S rRNA (guanine(527)-N(7))-methyltransferase RsmG [Eubacteriales bacterium]|nr:16S rRNA (guanine(527)-N(7))-methyltransferase RsmG [Eubacteriales bacterium]